MNPHNFETQKEDSICIKSFEEVIQNNFSDSSLTIDRIAISLSVPRRTLYRTIKKLTGQSPNQYVIVMRLEAAYVMLNSGLHLKVKEVAARVGFKKVDYFSQIFKEKYGVSPVEILRQP